MVQRRRGGGPNRDDSFGGLIAEGQNNGGAVHELIAAARLLGATDGSFSRGCCQAEESTVGLGEPQRASGGAAESHDFGDHRLRKFGERAAGRKQLAQLVL